MNDIVRNFVAWIAAEADPPRPFSDADPRQEQPQQQDASQRPAFSVGGLPVHNFPSTVSSEIPRELFSELPGQVPDQIPHPVAEDATRVGHPGEVGEHSSSEQSAEELLEQCLEESREIERQRRIYRGRTVAMLRRYMRYSIETGRLPSLLGREFFRAKVTSYTVTTFEDRVIFVHDMEICLERLDQFAREVLARVVLQEYEQEEAAALMGCTRMTVHRKLLEALDTLSDILVKVGLLDLLISNREKSCQGGKSGPFSISDCEQGK
jgi:predicted DNA-binding protein (UPF0251 family)